MTPDRNREEASQMSTDSETIREWANVHGVTPFRHEEDRHYHLVSSAEAGDRYERVEWNEFDNRVGSGEYVVIYYGHGQTESIEVVDRDEAIDRSNVERSELEERLDEDQTVTSEVAGAPPRDESVTAGEGTTPTTGSAEGADTSAATEHGEESGRMDATGRGAATGQDAAIGQDVATDQEATGPEDAIGTSDAEEQEPVTLSNEEIGKDVVDSSGESFGMVTDVSEDRRTIYVDAQPGITERIKAALDWGDAAEDDYPVAIGQIEDVSRDAVRLKDTAELDEARPTA